MARRYAENGWKLGVYFWELKDNGIRGRDGHTLIVELDGKTIKFHLDKEALVEQAKTARRGAPMLLWGTICKKWGSPHYKVHKITLVEDETEAEANRARISGKATRQGVLRQVGDDRDKCVVSLSNAGTEYELDAYDDKARTAATLKEGDEVALDMHFIIDPLDLDDPDTKHRLLLEIDTIEIEAGEFESQIVNRV